jgi:alkaline phosphatase D
MKSLNRVGVALLVVILLLLGISSGRSQGIRPALALGVASGDVTATSAVIWSRGAEIANSSLTVEYATDEQFGDAQRAEPVLLSERSDYTGKIFLKNLKPGTRYHYRVRQVSGAEESAPVTGTFVTAPEAHQSATVALAWSADLGGQGQCRRPEYFIFNALADAQPDLFLFLGDTAYNDERCPSPPNLPGSDFLANTLEEYRAKQKYQFADKPYQKARAASSLYAIWDDHEVINDFSGTTVEPQRLTIGRQVLLEYFPIAPNPQDSHRLYRSFRWGKHAEVFILDTRQYRSDNRLADGPEKTMLGREQLAWLKENLQRSDATWKFIVSTVTLSIPTACPARCDGWANAEGPTGFERELLEITKFILDNKIRNIVWLSGDMHLADAIQYDSDRDRVVDFYEFVAGPLSALTYFVAPLDSTLNPTRIFGAADRWNFGQIGISSAGRLTLEYRDVTGEVFFRREFGP